MVTVQPAPVALVALTGSSFAPDGAKTAHYGGVPASQVRPVYTNCSLHASMTQLFVYTGQLRIVTKQKTIDFTVVNCTKIC